MAILSELLKLGLKEAAGALGLDTVENIKSKIFGLNAKTAGGNADSQTRRA